MRHVAVFYRGGSRRILIPVTHIRSDLVPRKGDWIKIAEGEVAYEVLEAFLNLNANRAEVVIEEPPKGGYVAE